MLPGWAKNSQAGAFICFLFKGDDPGYITPGYSVIKKATLVLDSGESKADDELLKLC